MTGLAAASLAAGRATGGSPAAPRHVLALGASAGGLPALGEFLSRLPMPGHWSIVVAQHLQPGRPSALASLLQARSRWPVREARDGAWLAAGEVQVLPPGQIGRIENGRLRLRARDTEDAQGLIDQLFESLAAAWGARAVAVVFSGMGHDGTAGLRAVRDAGGLTAAQDPLDAEHPAMPASVLAADLAQLVATAPQLPARIADALLARSFDAPCREGEDTVPRADPHDAAFGEVLRRLRAQGGQGFERYKTSTVRRRIERRMGLLGLHRVADYARLLEDRPDEVELLFKEMLIGVTCFFRDPEIWQALAERVLPTLMHAASDGGPVRAWSAGCSTGEEPYSLAMLWREAMAQAATPRRLQIFASDLSAGALARARLGTYSQDRLDGVSATRRARHFIGSGRVRVTREVREMVLFAQHDLTADPPFGRLDLLICRNVLVYLQVPQQHDLMRLFHHCLRPGGWLVLGAAEILGPAAPLFEALDGSPHIYRRREGLPTGPALRPLLSPWLGQSLRDPAPMNEPDARPGSLHRQAERLVLDRFAPASILVNREGDLLWSCGPTARYLDEPDGRSNVNVLAQARPSLRAWLATALRELQASGPQGVELRGLAVVELGPDAKVDVSVLPFEAPQEVQALNLIVFREASVAPAGSPASGPDQLQAPASSPNQPDMTILRETLRLTRQKLQASTQDYQSANEELQASNEELTTSREEMQSMNEELQAINAELQAKLDALALEQSDMKNLLDSTQIATVFLDEDLNVRRFTEQARSLINLRDGDVGRPLSDLTTRLQHPGLVEQAAQVLRTLVTSEEEVPSADGRWFSVRILPYRTVKDTIAGVVITLTDTTRSDASQRARLSERDP